MSLDFSQPDQDAIDLIQENKFKEPINRTNATVLPSKESLDQLFRTRWLKTNEVYLLLTNVE